MRQFQNLEPQIAPLHSYVGFLTASGKGNSREDDDDEVDDEGRAGLQRRTRRRLALEEHNADA